jgi:hypothetical protein
MPSGLFTYGPFDSDVLDDVRYVEALGAVEGDPYPAHGPHTASGGRYGT